MEIMEKLENISVADRINMGAIEEMAIEKKIVIYEYVVKNYSFLKNSWKREKVEWLKSLIDSELINMGNFNLPKE